MKNIDERISTVYSLTNTPISNKTQKEFKTNKPVNRLETALKSKPDVPLSKTDILFSCITTPKD